MPRLIADPDGQQPFPIAGTRFGFTAVRLEKLGASQYTLATIVVDVTGSTSGFSGQLRDMLIASVEACKKHPTRDNLLVRVILFSSYYDNGFTELHGFTPVLEIDSASYPTLPAHGGTPLWDATDGAILATGEYAAKLYEVDFMSNGIVIVITDGKEGDAYNETISTATPRMIAQHQEEIRQSEKLESLITILVRINAAQFGSELEAFARDAKLTHDVDAGDVTPGMLAKVAGFISQSISSQSQALGSGNASENISATI